MGWPCLYGGSLGRQRQNRRLNHVRPKLPARHSVNEREAVSAVPESALMRKLELERGLKAGGHRLLVAQPDSARLIAFGPREAHRLARRRRIADPGQK